MSFKSKQLNRLGLVQAAAAIEQREISSVALLQACLDRIEERNAEVAAFVAYDSKKALAAAAEADNNTQLGPLRGIPFAVKDILDTADYPTEYGSPIYQGHQPHQDAVCVRLAKSRGAVLLGKVATGEFATQTPSKAKNPLNLAHTPGGSSSGSAAAVGDYMVPVAYATQTTGSIIRPAVFCGVVGYKPTFDLISPAGMKHLSPSQDTVGIITRSIEDAAFFTLGLHGAATVRTASLKPRVALCLSRQWDYVLPETMRAIESLVHHLESAGCTVKRTWLPDEYDTLLAIQPRLFMYEARHALVNERILHGDQLSHRLQTRLQLGEHIEYDEYVSMRQQVREAQQKVETLFKGVDAVLYPAAAGEADEGLASAGDPRFGALWTLLHLPSVSFPIDLGPKGLPLGVQMIARYGQDTRLLAVANAVTSIIGPVGPEVSG